MLALIMAAAVAASSSPSVSASRGTVDPVSWKRVSDQHGSSFDVPISLVSQQPAASDELAFQSRDGEASIRFSTMTEPRYGFPGHDPKADMDLKRSDCDAWPPQYFVMRGRLAAYSCGKGRKVTYYLAKYSPSGGVFLYVEYPAAQKAVWDKVIGRMAASVRQVARAGR
jgi:hypothetical protein